MFTQDKSKLYRLSYIYIYMRSTFGRGIYFFFVMINNSFDNYL